MLTIFRLLIFSSFFCGVAHAHDLSRVMIDMSSNNATMEINESVIKKDRVELIVHRLTIGRYYKDDPDNKIDDLFVRRMKEAKAHGIRFGAYHVIWPSVTGKINGIEQATGFLRAIKDYCLPDLRILLAVDWEHIDYKKANRRHVVGTPNPDYLREFLEHVKKETGKTPVIYTNGNALTAYAARLNEPEFKNLLLQSPLWIAQYHRRYKFENTSFRLGHVFPQSDDIKPWSNWHFWQFAEPPAKDKPAYAPTSRTKLTVGNQPVDLNYFDGSREEFREFIDKIDNHTVVCGKF